MPRGIEKPHTEMVFGVTVFLDDGREIYMSFPTLAKRCQFVKPMRPETYALSRPHPKGFYGTRAAGVKFRMTAALGAR